MALIFCTKLNKEADALDRPPFPGELGERIFKHISKQAWKEWLSQQTMLINEYRLNLVDAKSREFLRTEMEKFFFSTGFELPEGFTPPE